MPRYSRDFYIAMDSFLLSEKARHQEDIDAIDAKRAILHDLGYDCEGKPAPWIKDEDIQPQEVPKINTEYGSYACVSCDGCGRCDESHECTTADGTLAYRL